jgi:hypothetical protein
MDVLELPVDPAPAPVKTGMDAFKLHADVKSAYEEYLRSFFTIKDADILQKVEKMMEEGKFLPDPLIQFNPSFKISSSIDDLIAEGVIHPELKRVFGSKRLFDHQIEALRCGTQQKGFIVTSGTGSGKSLTYLSTVFDHIIRLGSHEPGIRAILVYPMNALINSQVIEIQRYERDYLLSFLSEDERRRYRSDKPLDDQLKELSERTGRKFPITYAQYTGQTKQAVRELIEGEKPDIILTNYMMLELAMTRRKEQWMREAMRDHLRYLVLDELHFYRGRQGADISMLMKRIQGQAQHSLTCIGTSATMASGNTADERKDAVAVVASSVFGKKYNRDQIVEETLDLTTTLRQGPPSAYELREAIEAGVDLSAPEELFKNDPVAIWLEQVIALRYEEGRWLRNKPCSLSSLDEKLATAADVEVEISQNHLRNMFKWTERLNMKAASEGRRTSFLPLKIHQFISQTNTIHVTLDPPGVREIVCDEAKYLKKDGEQRDLYPVLFSRFTGVDFVCMELDPEKHKIRPRDPDDLPLQQTKKEILENAKAFNRPITVDLFPKGYLLFEEDLWGPEDERDLPNSWYRSNGIDLEPYYKARLPRKIYLNRDGGFSWEPKATNSIQAWYVPAKLLIDPTCGVTHDERAKEYTKLMRLGNEGRSTATTVLSHEVVGQLTDQGVGDHRNKLLSFTDNRQDASLQSGHFNDWITTIKLRSAIQHAIQQAGEAGVRVETLPERMFEQLGLKEAEYARNPAPDPNWPDEDNTRALKDYLLVRAVYDLKRGWRYNTPNLEQCALLCIDYYKLDQFTSEDRFWAGLPVLESIPSAERREVVRQVLDFFRTSYAIDHFKLDRDRATVESFLKDHLDPSKPWALEQEERLEIPYYLSVAPVRQTGKGRYIASMGPRSYLGKYVKKLHTLHGLPYPNEADTTRFLEKLVTILHTGHFITKETIRLQGTDVTGHRLRLDKVIWKKGDREHVAQDRVRIRTNSDLKIKPNRFFQRLYERPLADQAQIIGREHTAQIDGQMRIKREEDFRKGDIKALFCSPTMELGIDIAELSVVHMRNVPPNPANYAQRSGRAGRSGQTALVFTYCSGTSPHDRNYFKRQMDMVSGQVTPARIDLTNEELIAAHCNAFFLMKLGLNDLNKSVKDLLVLEHARELPLKEDIIASISRQIEDHGQRWLREFVELLGPLDAELRERTAWGYGDAWLNQRYTGFLTRFDQSFQRWRALFIAAQESIAKSTRILQDPTFAPGSPERHEAEALKRAGLRQRDLLLNEEESEFGGNSEFYVFRYLASEGFLPGYNFTRLPVRVFVGNRFKKEGEFISRPRNVALYEFGPQNIIYHNGSKFQVNRMMITDMETGRHGIKVSRATGYAYLDEDMDGANVDPITHQPLEGEQNVRIQTNLLQLDEMEAQPRERITCEEEERTREGFEIRQYFSYPLGISSTKQAVIMDEDLKLLNLIHGPSTSLIQVNERWRRIRDDGGFRIHPGNGKWLSKSQAQELVDQGVQVAQVRLYTTLTADTLYVQPMEQLGIDKSATYTLGYALKRAIETKFSLEENEIGVIPMGEKDPNLMLFESTEGSLGVLSRLVEEPVSLNEIWRMAYKQLHFDLDTREDKRTDLPKASYEDLLSYFNQRHHDELDRFAVKPALERLMGCTAEPTRYERNYDEHFDLLFRQTDASSELERRFLKGLKEQGLALPDRAQVNLSSVTGHYISADFLYENNGTTTLVFIDGAVHDTPEQKAADEHKRNILRDRGYDVVVWHYLQNLIEFLRSRLDIFRKVR